MAEYYRNAWYAQLMKKVNELEEEIEKAIELPTVTSADEGKVLTVDSEGKWDAENVPKELPTVTSTDEGKVLTVDGNGDWAAENVPKELPTVTGADEGKVLTVDSNGNWGAENVYSDFKFRGRIYNTLGYTKISQCRLAGWYYASTGEMVSLTDLPADYHTDSSLLLKVYDKMSASNYIRQELYNNDSTDVWCRIIASDGTTYRDWYNTAVNSINILLVGNSFTLDENSYLPALLKEAAPELRFNIGILYEGGTDLYDQVSFMTNDTPYSYYYEYNSYDTKWVSIANTKLSDVINKYKWNLVSFTSANRSFTNYQTDILPQLKQLIDGYTAMVNHNIQFALHFSHILATNYDGDDHIPGTGNTSASFYESVAPNFEAILHKIPLYDVFQTATAIQNARTTTLDNLGTGTYKDMTYDGRHLQEGVCCMVPAYLMLYKILDFAGIKKYGVIGSQILPSSTWISEQNIPGQHGTSQGATSSDCMIAAKCAIMAYRNPFTITDCSTL